MKKVLLGLFALAASAFCAMLPTAASAATVTLGGVTCNNNNGTSFPTTQFWYCVPSGSNQLPLVSRMSNTGSDAKTRFTSSGGQLYVFQNPADYFAFCGGGTVLACDASVGTNGEWGKTVYGSPTYSVTLERDANGILNPHLDATFMHEMGHQLDVIYGALLGSGGTGFVSGDTVTFIPELNNKAWPKFNSAYTVQCGTTGLFRAQISAAGTYICNGTNGLGTGLNTGFSGNNQSVLQTAWPSYFTASGGAYKELFAETFARSTGGLKSGGANPQYYIGKDGFACMVTIVNTLQDHGRFPISGEYPSYCR